MDMLIDGGWTGASDGSVDRVLNPATDDQIATVPRASPADVERAVAAAQRGARPQWLRCPPGGGTRFLRPSPGA